MSPAEIWGVLELMEKLEAKMIGLYNTLAARFKDDDDAATLFTRLALDETRHLEIIKFEIGLVFKTRRDFTPVEADKDAVRAAMMSVDLFLKTLKDTELEDVIRFIMKIELDNAELYYKSKIMEANPKVVPLIKSLMREEHQHYAKIHHFATRREISHDFPADPKDLPAPDPDDFAAPAYVEPRAAVAEEAEDDEED